MDLANDERIKRLHQQIQEETDRDKLLELAKELCRVLDVGRDGKLSERRLMRPPRRAGNP